MGALFGRTADVNVMIGFGVTGVAALTAFLMRMAFHSSRKGYDEPLQFEKRSDRDDGEGA